MNQTRSSAQREMWWHSRYHTTAFRVVISVLALGGEVRAQDTSATSRDSLAARLRRAEESIELLRQQLAADAESRVQAASRVRLDIFGRVLMNAFSNSARVNNADIPLFALRTDTGGSAGLGAALRQTTFGIAITSERVLGGTFAGELHTDFYGGQQPSTGGRHFPLLRIRRAFGVLTWARGEVLFGQDNPLIAGLSPASVASVGTPEFTGAGNLWLWLPQVRGTVELGRSVALQGALLAPTSGDPADAFDTPFDAAERSRRPYLQARLRWRHASWGEVGAGVHRGWLRRSDGQLITSEAVAADVAVKPAEWMEARGEAYSGKAVRGLGGGGAGQGLRLGGQPVKDRGAWAQLILRPSTLASISAGCGVGDPTDTTDLPADRLRNSACAFESVVTPGGGLLFALAWRSQRTTYTPGTRRNRHLNFAAGFEF
ncbi:MAG: hypothetical protein ACT4OZ_07740 [Gemmatimonadota bacterium]